MTAPAPKLPAPLAPILRPLRARGGGGSPRERGSIIVAVIVVLVVVSIVVAGVVIQGRADQDTTLYRLDAGRARAAVEAGVQMSLREMYGNTDEDADGTIGGITGITVNNCAVGVTRSTSGITTTLTATATGTYCSRKTQVVLQEVYPTKPWAFFRNATDKKMWCSYRDNTTYTWSAPTVSGTTNDIPEWVIAHGTKLTGYPVVVGCLDKSSTLSIGLANATTGVATYTSVCTDVGAGSPPATRPYDIGIEGISGRAVIVYDDKPAGDILRYRTYDGTLSAAASTGLATTKLDWVTCYSEPNSNNFIMLTLDDTKKIYAANWDGTAWGSRTQLGGVVDNFGYECYSGAYMQVSGDFIAVYPDNGNNMYYSVYHAGAWGSSTLIANIGTKPRWFHLAARPGTNEVYCALMGDDQKVRLTRWSGSAWDAITTVATASGAKDRRMFDLAISPDGTSIVAAYDRNANTYYYRQYTGGAWAAETAGYDTGGKVWIVQLHSGPGNADIIGSLANNNNALWAFRWNGSAFSNSLQVNADVGSDDKYERFWADPGIAVLRIQSYSSVAP